MKYQKRLSKKNKAFFDCWFKEFTQSVSNDNKENELGLTKSDIEIIAWNCASLLLVSYSKYQAEALIKEG